MKSTILLTTALFLVSAPSPDSKSVSELSGGFLAETINTGLMASDVAAGAQAGPDVAAQSLIQTAPEDNTVIVAAVGQAEKHCIANRKDC